MFLEINIRLSNGCWDTKYTDDVRVLSSHESLKVFSVEKLTGVRIDAVCLEVEM